MFFQISVCMSCRFWWTWKTKKKCVVVFIRASSCSCVVMKTTSGIPITQRGVQNATWGVMITVSNGFHYVGIISVKSSAATTRDLILVPKGFCLLRNLRMFQLTYDNPQWDIYKYTWGNSNINLLKTCIHMYRETSIGNNEIYCIFKMCCIMFYFP